MRIACIQMDMKFASPEDNFEKAGQMIRAAASNGADVCVLPETWNTGFFPKESLEALSDNNGAAVKREIGGLAKELSINIVAGSVANKKQEKIYNTCYVFDRSGNAVFEYDKTHLFSPMHEDEYFTPGDNIGTFRLDGILCGIMICYDLRFPELARSMTTEGEHLDCMFLVSQWPVQRISHFLALSCARAIENQMFFACCNSAGKAGDTVYGGSSVVYDPLGEALAKAGGSENIIYADCNMALTEEIVSSINVFRDRRTSLYKIK